MAILKINEGKMTKNRKPKPTNNDFVVIINSLIQEIHSLKNDMQTIMGAFDMYVDFKKDGDAYSKHIEKEISKGSDGLQESRQDNQVANTASPTN